ncbi:MAG: nicotinate-nucleotide--dimethylbenzimidazole phosphoribosyltransferase [Spirochaetota bacterium]|nr:nicotinate-nucleotide--dimethylbenzimidazole phosphoribosyltransferase [Spirochaetota bacterium]
MLNFNIEKLSEEIKPLVNRKIDSKTKPIGSLGLLENIATRIALIQNSTDINLKNPHIVIFAADHGITAEGVSKYPQEVTYQMVYNFLSGGAAINVFAKQHNINLKVVDAGVNHNFSDNQTSNDRFINAKIQTCTKNFLYEKAMTETDCLKAIDTGAKIVESIKNSGCNIIGFGEMGIGNTSSAAILMSLLCYIPIEQCVGRGTGLNDAELKKKVNILTSAILNHKDIEHSSLSILSTFGGFEIAMMVGSILKAAELKMIILIDGFITSSALLTAFKINENVLDYSLFSHQSNESGHKLMLDYLKVKPILNFNMRLGEGTGCAIVYPIIQSAVNFFNEMASFESASVSQHV